jgi:hypothetical protein
MAESDNEIPDDSAILPELSNFHASAGHIPQALNSIKVALDLIMINETENISFIEIYQFAKHSSPFFSYFFFKTHL